jgi:hypothetical protein
MAKLADKGTYVYLDDACVWIDYKTGRLHLTSNDRDIPGNGIHLSIKTGTKTEQNLRGLLEKVGIPVTAAERDVRDAAAKDKNDQPISKHHKRAVTWDCVVLPVEVSRLLAIVASMPNWHTDRVSGDAANLTVRLTYGPVFGAYPADLRRLFEGSDLSLVGFTEVRSVCAGDCTHPSHNQGKI